MPSGVALGTIRVTVIWKPGERERCEKHFEHAAALANALTKPLAKQRAFAAKVAKAAEGGAEAMRLYEAAPAAQQRRMRNMTIRDVLKLRPVLERRPQPRERPRPRERRSARRATVTTSRRRTQARDGPDDGSGSDEPPPERELARLRGFGAASVRMFAHVGRRLAAEKAAG
jgi:hypothetical protein